MFPIDAYLETYFMSETERYMYYQGLLSFYMTFGCWESQLLKLKRFGFQGKRDAATLECGMKNNMWPKYNSYYIVPITFGLIHSTEFFNGDYFYSEDGGK